MVQVLTLLHLSGNSSLLPRQLTLLVGLYQLGQFQHELIGRPVSRAAELQQHSPGAAGAGTSNQAPHVVAQLRHMREQACRPCMLAGHPAEPLTQTAQGPQQTASAEATENCCCHATAVLILTATVANKSSPHAAPTAAACAQHAACSVEGLCCGAHGKCTRFPISRRWASQRHGLPTWSTVIQPICQACGVLWQRSPQQMPIAPEWSP